MVTEVITSPVDYVMAVPPRINVSLRHRIMVSPSIKTRYLRSGRNSFIMKMMEHARELFINTNHFTGKFKIIPPPFQTIMEIEFGKSHTPHKMNSTI